MTLTTQELSKALHNPKKALFDLDHYEAEKSLLRFVQLGWHALEPGVQFVTNYAVMAMCDHLEAVTNGDIRRLIINVPPGFSKSMIVSVFYSAWEWGPKGLPHYRYISFSHERDLAIRDVVRCRDLMLSEWYQAHWGKNFSFKQDQNQKTFYENNVTGWRQACAAGSLTGRRGDRLLCLPYDQTIFTSSGYIKIGDIVENRLNVLVLGANSETLTWQKIEKYEKNPGSKIIEIVTKRGSFRCTPNHPVYVSGKGWIEASDLRKGDRVKRISQEQFDKSLQVLSWQNAPFEYGKTKGLEDDVIEYIREAGYEHATYNVNVVDDHVYFAGDILVHNCDDPHSVRGADSDAQREEVIQIMSETVPTRLNKQAESAIVIVMQRVHERDTSGHLLAKELGYEHLMLPMEFEKERRCYSIVKPSYIENPQLEEVVYDKAKHMWLSKADYDGIIDDNTIVSKRYCVDPRKEDGELLDPVRFPRHAVEELKAALSSFGGSYAVAGQLAQRPAPRGGGMFKKSDFQIIDSIADFRIKATVRGWDFAGSTGKKSPYSVGVKMAKTFDNKIIILDVNRFKKTPMGLERELLATAKRDGKNVIIDFPQDPGQAGKSQKLSFIKLLQGYRVKTSPETGSKQQRAEPFAAQVEGLNVYMLRGDWNDAFINEASLFPNSEFKDQIDAASRAYARLLNWKHVVVGTGAELITG